MEEIKDFFGGIITAIIAVIVIGILFVILCVRHVDTGYTGLLITFGKPADNIYTEGIVIKAPWQSLVTLDNRIQINGSDDKAIELSSFSKDIQEVKIKYTVNYKLDRSNVKKLYSEIGKDYFVKVLAPAIQESVKNQCAKYTAEELVGDRSVFAQAIEDELKVKFLDSYVELTSTDIEDMDFSDAFTNAVEAKQVAAQEKLQAEQVAEKKKIEADADAYVKVKQAEADAQANELKNKSITDNLIKYEAVKIWDGKLPTVSGGESLPIINLK